MRIITGTGRCGTSLAALIARAAGGDFGDEETLIPADRHNPRGYLENREVVYLNTILQLGEHIRPAELFEARRVSPARRAINRASKVRYLMPSPAADIMARARRRQSTIVEIGHRFRGKVVKDPRFCSTIHAWAAFVPVEGVLYCIRHPSEVARSLAHAYRVPVAVGYWLWHVRVGEFLANSRGLPVTVVDFGRLTDPETAHEECARVFRFLNRPEEPDLIDRIVNETVVGALRRFSADDTGTPERARALYDLLCRYHAHHGAPAPLNGAEALTGTDGD